MDNNFDKEKELENAYMNNRLPNPNVNDVQTPIGWMPVNKEDLPSLGRFYSKDLHIIIRALKTPEVEHYSIMNDQNPLDVEKHFNDILKSACQLKMGAIKLSYKNLLEGDKLYIILAIKDLTFIKNENQINLNISCKHCGHSNKRELNNSILTKSSYASETLEKYYSDYERCYVLNTKSYGEIRLYAPTVGSMEYVFNYGMEQEKKQKHWNKSFYQLLPFLADKELNENVVKRLLVDYSSWDKKKLSLVYKMCEEIKIGIKPDISINCDGCGEAISEPFQFPNGAKSLFIISNFDDELI